MNKNLPCYRQAVIEMGQYVGYGQIKTNQSSGEWIDHTQELQQTLNTKESDLTLLESRLKPGMELPDYIPNKFEQINELLDEAAAA